MRFRKKTLHRALALALLAGVAQPVLAVNEWTGAADRVFNNPENWTGGVLPPGGASPGDQNAAVINLATGNTPLINSYPEAGLYHGLVTGYGNQKRGKLDIQVPASVQSLYFSIDASGNQDPNLRLAPQQPGFRVGDQGGTGIVNIDVSSADAGQHYYSPRVDFHGTGPGLGLGAGSDGALNVLGAGKEDWQNGYPVSPYGVAFQEENAHALIGDSGGKGALQVDGAALVLQTGAGNDPLSTEPFTYLKIGKGTGSIGTVEVLGSGKFSANTLGGYGSNYVSNSNASIRPFTYLGLEGGTGSVKVSSTTAGANKSRNQADFPTGLRVGSTGGTGSLEILAGGKALISNGQIEMSSDYCAASPSQSPFPAALQISTDGKTAGSSGTVRVDGAGAELMVSGAYNNYGMRPGSPVIATADAVGHIQIGTGGALLLANGGIAEVGLTRLEQKDITLPPPNDSEAYYGVFIPIGGLGTVEVNDKGRVLYGALPGETLQAPGEVQAAWINLNDADASVVFNHNGANFSFDRALKGNGRIVQLAGATEIAATLASAPVPDPAVWEYDTDATCRPPIADSYPTNQNAFTGTLDIQGGTLVLPASRVLLNTVATAISGGTLMQGGTTQNLGSVNMTGGTLQMTGGTTPGATDVAEASSWTGSGGTVQLDTVLGNDGNPSDKLVISGAASGTTYLQINNLGGAGAATTGNGILVVDMQGNTSSNNSFALASPVQDSGFSYMLKKQGNGNWYLVSQRADLPLGAGSPAGGASQPIPALPLPALALLGGLMAAAGGYLRRRSAAGGK